MNYNLCVYQTELGKEKTCKLHIFHGRTTHMNFMSLHGTKINVQEEAAADLQKGRRNLTSSGAPGC